MYVNADATSGQLQAPGASDKSVRNDLTPVNGLTVINLSCTANSIEAILATSRLPAGLTNATVGALSLIVCSKEPKPIKFSFSKDRPTKISAEDAVLYRAYRETGHYIEIEWVVAKKEK
jgi:hypothetical protein